MAFVSARSNLLVLLVAAFKNAATAVCVADASVRGLPLASGELAAADFLATVEACDELGGTSLSMLQLEATLKVAGRAHIVKPSLNSSSSTSSQNGTLDASLPQQPDVLRTWVPPMARLALSESSEELYPVDKPDKAEPSGRNRTTLPKASSMLSVNGGFLMPLDIRSLQEACREIGCLQGLAARLSKSFSTLMQPPLPDGLPLPPGSGASEPSFPPIPDPSAPAPEPPPKMDSELSTTFINIPVLTYSQTKNTVALFILLVWGVTVVLVVVQYVSPVLWPEAEQDAGLDGVGIEVGRFSYRKKTLGDEQAAWEESTLSWLGLGWVDDVMSRFGFGRVTKASFEELKHWDPSTPYPPLERLRFFWNREVAERGKNANLLRVIIAFIRPRTMAAILACSWGELILKTVGGVIAYDVYFGFLAKQSQMLQDQPGSKVDWLMPTILVLVFIFGIQWMGRVFAVISSLLDGWGTNMICAGLNALVGEKTLRLRASAAFNSVKTNSVYEDIEGPDQLPDLPQMISVDCCAAWGQQLRNWSYLTCLPGLIITLNIMMFLKLKLAAFYAFLIILPGYFIGLYVLYLVAKNYSQLQGVIDYRMRLLAESLWNIRVIKATAWEEKIAAKIHDARVAEMNALRYVLELFIAILTPLGTATPRMVMLLTLILYEPLYGPVPAAEVLIALQILGFVLASWTQMTMMSANCVMLPNSWRRITQVLMAPEAEYTWQQADGDELVRLQGSYGFSERKDPVLKNIDVAIKRGEKVAIVGEVGCGKSALLCAMLGELIALGDTPATLRRPQDATYCAQAPWIFEGTMVDNIVCGESVDPERLQSCIRAAGLESDVATFPGGAQSTIGAKGVRLSGGQRMRLSLARAAYRRRGELALFDDPLAAVDTHTADALVEEFFFGDAMQGRTVVMAIQPEESRIRRFDRIILLVDGEIVAQGPPSEISSLQAFTDLLSKVSKSLNARVQKADTTRRANRIGETNQSQGKLNLRDEEETGHVDIDTLLRYVRIGGWIRYTFFIASMIGTSVFSTVDRMVIADWVNDRGGAVALYSDWYYIALFGLMCFLQVFSQVMGGVLFSSFTFVVGVNLHDETLGSLLKAPLDKFFDSQPVGRIMNRMTGDLLKVDRGLLLSHTSLITVILQTACQQGYVWLVIPFVGKVGIAFMWAAIIWFLMLYKNAIVPLRYLSAKGFSVAQDLYADLLPTIVSVRAFGYSEERVQRICAAGDMMTTSNYLCNPGVKLWCLSRCAFLICTQGALVAAVGVFFPAELAEGTMGLAVMLSVGTISILENNLDLMFDCLNALISLQRVFEYCDLEEKYGSEGPRDMVADRHISALRVYLSREDLGNLEVVKTAVDEKPIVFVQRKNQPPVLRSAEDGSILELVPGAQASDLFPTCTDLRKLGSICITEVNAAMQDAAAMADELKAASEAFICFRSRGLSSGANIRFRDFCAGYRGNPDVLHDITFEIVAGAKAGIAGKTGCGKSTTMQCMLRILEARRGRIDINDIPIGELGLRTLRTTIGLVPQEPMILGGSLRHNLDPFDEYPDSQVWQALERVKLKATVEAWKDGLDHEIMFEGSNLSVGQRQLISFARMVCRQPPVLLLDEATSSIDPATQEAVQAAIHSSFTKSTIVAIAHRLETLVDFDQVILLDHGRVIEQGHPTDLLKQDGVFAGMLKARAEAIQ